jgi:hypothetical protein
MMFSMKTDTDHNSINEIKSAYGLRSAGCQVSVLSCFKVISGIVRPLAQ